MSSSPRSYLFVPGNRPERFDKALASGADAVIVDLEDAVPPDQKDAARRSVGAWLAAARPVVLRINAADTAWFAADLALCRSAPPDALAAVMVAKAERAEALAALHLPVPLLPLIESAAGIDQLVLASRLAGVAAPIDSPSVAINDAGEVERDALAARRLGFGAKLCIHPRQLEAVNRSFSPTEAEIAWARRVLAVAEASGGAAVALDGRMIDKPVILRAQAILAEVR
jgi:citrate lyase subunit beta/citryl-CoA lyase